MTRFAVVSTGPVGSRGPTRPHARSVSITHQAGSLRAPPLLAPHVRQAGMHGQQASSLATSAHTRDSAASCPLRDFTNLPYHCPITQPAATILLLAHPARCWRRLRPQASPQTLYPATLMLCWCLLNWPPGPAPYVLAHRIPLPRPSDSKLAEAQPLTTGTTHSWAGAACEALSAPTLTILPQFPSHLLPSIYPRSCVCSQQLTAHPRPRPPSSSCPSSSSCCSSWPWQPPPPCGPPPPPAGRRGGGGTCIKFTK